MPDNLKPSLYELTIKPYIGTNETYAEKAFTYEGTMKINFDCLKPTKKIVFHSNELDIDESKLNLMSSGEPMNLNIINTEYDPITEFYTVNLNDNCLQSKNYTLLIEYKGSLRTELNGFYRSSYLDEIGQRK